MQENRFEKQVQEQMEELQLHPSAGVWEKVELELRKKKRRRVVFFLSLLAGLGLLGYSGYIYMGDSSKDFTKIIANKKTNNNQQPAAGTGSQVNNQPEENTVSNSAPSDKESIKDNQALPESKKESSADQQSSIIAGENTSKDQKDIAANKELIKQRETPAKRKKEAKNADKSVVKLLTPKVDQKLKEQEELNIEAKTVSSKIKEDKPTVQNENLVATTKTTAPQTDIARDTAAARPVLADTSVAQTTIQPEATPVVKLKKAGRINWGIDLSFGRSVKRDQAFPSVFAGNKTFEQDALTSGGPGLPGAPPPTPILPPSDVKGGPAFHIGAVAEIKLTSKTKLNVGLRYAYQSDRIKTGNYRDTSFMFSNFANQNVVVRAVYTGTQQKTHTNHYHFIQVPVQYALQLNKGKKLPVSLQLGGTLGYLVATNGLMYDTTLGGIYYKDRKVFNKFHFSLNSGIYLHFGQKSKIQWSIGPEFSLDMSRFAKSGAYDPKQYMFYGGITGRLFLPKKKK